MSLLDDKLHKAFKLKFVQRGIMKIEVLIGSGRPKIYSITNPVTILGSDPRCDIVVQNKFVSRKHLQIIKTENHFQVMDLGSSNGTYLNEEKILPNVKNEFSLYSPFRLGKEVLISLVEESEDEKEENNLATSHDETKILTAKILSKIKTQKLIKRRDKLRLKTPSKVDPLKILAIIIIVMAVCYEYYSHEKKIKSDREKLRKEQSALQVIQAAQKKETISESKLIAPKASWKTHEKSLLELIKKPKCSTELELVYCNLFVGAAPAPGLPWGIIISEKKVNIFVDGSFYFSQSKELLNEWIKSENMVPSTGNRSFDNKDIWEVAGGLFAANSIKANIDFTKLAGNDLRIVFLGVTSENITIESLIIANPEEFKKTRQLLNNGRIEAIRISGPPVVKFTREFYEFMMRP